MKKLWLLMLTLVMSIAMVGRAQETTGAVQGIITDPTGAVVVGATVTATGDKLIGTAKATTDKRGFYRLNALPPGTYSLTVQGSGMAAKANDLRLSAGDLPNLNFTLAPGAMTVVEVSSAVAQVDVTQSKVETTISNEVLQEIPKGRSFQSVIPFAPGARQEPLQSLSGSVLAGNRTGGFQIDGASDSENVYSSEGVNITGIVGGGVGYNVPIEFVQDVQVKSSSFEAEYGGALGGVINVIQQRGSNNWHGSILGYYRSSALNATDQCNISSTCGLGRNPATVASSSTRTDQAAWYYVGKQDHYRIVNPGFTLGGPLYKDKLWMFASYIPEFYRLRRDVSFTAANPGPRQFYQNQDQHYGFARFDYGPISKLRLFASWEDLYTRLTGNSLPGADSKLGQFNSSSTTDPATFRADSGVVSPAAIYAFGADYTLTSKTLVTARYGYLYNDSQDRGKPVGVRDFFENGSVSGTGVPVLGLDGVAVPAAYQKASNFANIASNTQTKFNILQRKSFSADISYLTSGIFGTHNFKGGYAWNGTNAKLNSGSNTALVYEEYGVDYTPQTSATACDAIIQANVTKYGSPALGHCRGNYGYVYVYDFSTGGTAKGTNSAFYGQDSWSIAHTGLTINAGVRFDKEYLPPYNPGASSIGFGFSQKVAPRIGAAYDVLHNGKLKLYGSYGKFFDIVKYSLPQGSFGGEYWHNCVYALDDPNYNAFVPGNNSEGHACPVTGAAIGVASSYRFIENNDLRKNVINAADPGVDPNVKPMSQHEFVVGSEWAATPTLSFTARYSRKRLENTIEDIGVNDNLGFYIGNPGPGYGDLLKRTLVGQGYTQPLCASCPDQPKARRDYDGLEFRITKMGGTKFFFTAFYTYSRLQGNYPGLTSTFATDGAGGRHNPNNNRSFDQPHMQFDSHGNYFGGPLPTDRPNTVGGFGSYRVRWFGGETQLGLSQAAYQGTPVSTAWPVVSSSAVQFVEGQGNWLPITRAADGSVTAGAIQKGRRTPAYFQTDSNLTHYVHVSKDHENRKFGGELNVSNLLGQHAVMGYNEIPLTGATYPISTANPVGTDFKALETGWDYIGTSNNTTSVGRRTVSNLYGNPNLFQAGRQLRIKVAYVF